MKPICKQIRKLVKGFEDVREDAGITKEYWDAIRSLDLERMMWFEQFGPTVRHRILNASCYRGHVAFGYPEIKLDEHGWLENVEWVEVENIELRTSHKLDKHFTGNYVTLACGRNGRWTYSRHYQTGSGASGGYSPWPNWHQPIISRNEALVMGLNDIKEELIPCVDRKDDPANVSPEYIRKVLVLLEQAYPKQAEQLTLFV